MPHLIVIYGAPLTGKSSLAREVAARLGEKAAVVSADGLLNEAIRVHDADTYAELDMVYTQVRLLVANYLKSRYHVVLEGAFLHDIAGVLQRREQDIDQTMGLMRNLASAPLLVRLAASAETLRARAADAARDDDVETALRIQGEYRQRYGARSLELTTDGRRVDELAGDVMKQLDAGYI